MCGTEKAEQHNQSNMCLSITNTLDYETDFDGVIDNIFDFSIWHFVEIM